MQKGIFEIVQSLVLILKTLPYTYKYKIFFFCLSKSFFLNSSSILQIMNQMSKYCLQSNGIYPVKTELNIFTHTYIMIEMYPQLLITQKFVFTILKMLI